uniref:Flotillin-like n=1 Tax=Lactuca sativa TaxID=4236 RepID=A0A9R1WL81_LACSA|nr:hypothetical protein LSAT_V11C200062360 [Lactuca sativa]
MYILKITGIKLVSSHSSRRKYAKLIASHDIQSHHVIELVKGIIEGETCVLTASMTMEEIFKGRKDFKKEVFDEVQLELNQFGFLIYNANVKQMVDAPRQEYFSYLGQKVQQEAANQANNDVSKAKMKGEIGSKIRQDQTLQNAVKIDAETKIIATQRQGQWEEEGDKGENGGEARDEECKVGQGFIGYRDGVEKGGGASGGGAAEGG